MTDLSNFRVLMLDLSTRLGGASVRALALIEAFPAGIAALACLSKGQVIDAARARGVEAHGVASHKSDPLIPLRVARLLQIGKFQVIDTVNPQSKLWGSMAAALSGTALVSTLNSWYSAEHGGRLKGRVYQWLELLTAYRTDVFIAVAPDIRANLLARGIPETSAVLIMNAVGITPEKIAIDLDSFRIEFDLPAHGIVLCAVGRLVEAKGFEHLVSSMSMVANKRDDVFCLIIGEGHLRSAIEQKIAQLGLTQRVRLCGFREPDEVLKIVKASDVFVLPSLTEGTPISLLEAAALGRPIIASRVGGIPDIVRDGEQALLVEPGDETALAEAILYLCEHQAGAAALGRQARAHIQKEFSLTAQAEATIDAYRLALHKRHRVR